MASTTQQEKRDLDTGLPRIPGWKAMNSWSIIQISWVQLTYSARARTGHRDTRRWAACQSEPSVGAEYSLTNWERWKLERAFSKKAVLSWRTTLFSSSNHLQQSLWTDSAWISLTFLADVMDSWKAVLSDSHFESVSSRGSKVGRWRVPRTTLRSQGGTGDPGLWAEDGWANGETKWPPSWPDRPGLPCTASPTGSPSP